jgi:GDP-mannose 4,6-dehydratase
MQPDEVYNLAGQSSVGLSFEQPVETLESIATGTLNLLEAIRFIGAPIRLYNAGSSECFGETGEAGADENTPFRPRSPYAVAKAAAFWEVANYREAYGLFACSGILFNHESPLRPERFVTQKIVTAACRIAEGSTEKLTLGNMAIRRDWGWAPEYVEAMSLMLQQEQPEDYVIATGESCSLEEFVAIAFAAVGLDWRDWVVSDCRRVAAMAADAGIRVALEYHGGTLTDDLESARQLLESAAHPNLRSLWQPRNGASVPQRLRDLEVLKPWLDHVHVFHWSAEGKRLLLEQGAEWWKPSLQKIREILPSSPVLIEFVEGNEPEALLRDAAALRAWIQDSV